MPDAFPLPRSTNAHGLVSKTFGSRKRGLAILFFSLLWTLPPAQRVTAQPPGLFPDNDPLSAGDTDSLRQVERYRARRQGPRVGPVLTAVPGVRETEHGMSVHLHQGLATVAIRHRFERPSFRTGRYPAEVRYRMPVPAGASLSFLEVCRGTTCRRSDGEDGVTGDDARLAFEESFTGPETNATEGAPAERATAHVHIAEGFATLRVAPLTREPLHVEWAYVIDVAAHADVVRMELPPRGNDPRIAMANVTFTAEGYRDVHAQERPLGTRATQVAPWDSLRLHATVDGPAHDVLAYHCEGEDNRWCLRTYDFTPLRPRSADRRVALLIDASPSMLEGARSHVVAAANAIVAQLGRARVRVMRFGTRPAWIQQAPIPAADLPEGWLDQATTFQLDLGAHTDIGEALHTLEPRPREHVVVLGDGGGLLQQLNPGVRMSYVMLSAEDSAQHLKELVLESGGVWVVANEDDATIRADERVRSLWARQIGGRLTGESETSRRSVRRPPRRARRATPDLATALRATNKLTVRGHAIDTTRIGISLQAERHRRQQQPDSVQSGHHQLLFMLRTRLVPPARRCFRRDRRGRLNHSVRATYELTLAHRELVSTRITGEMPDLLRTCLVEAAEHIAVPPFEGTVVIRYPLYTEPAEEPPPELLQEGVAQELDQLLVGVPSDGADLQ